MLLGARPSRQGAAWPLTVLALSVASAFAGRGVLSPLQEAVRADLHIDDFGMSLVQGLAASAPGAALSIPLGRMVDRSNRVRILFWLSLAWVAGAVLTSFATGFTTLFAARMLAGVGAVCALPAAISIAADCSRPETRGRTLLVLSLGNYVGVALAFALAGALLSALAGQGAALHGLAPWRAVNLVFAAIGAGLALLLLLLREPPRRELERAGAPLGQALQELWARRAWLAPLFVGQVGVVMADTAAGVWAAPLLVRDFHQTPQAFSGWMGLLVLGAGLVGSVGGGLVADLSQRARAPGGILFGAAVASTLALPGAFFAVAATLPMFAVLLALFLICGSITGLVTAATIAVLLPNETRGVALGAFLVIGAIIGLGVAPTLVAAVSSVLGGEAALGRALALVGAGVSLIYCVAFWIAIRSAPSHALAEHAAVAS